MNEMNEVEIINYLKCNMSNGIAFRFMPVEVRSWVANHLDDCTILTAEGVWDKASGFIHGEFDPAAFNVFGLLASYKPKSEKKESGGWVEFEIKDYFFEFIDENKDAFCYDWFLWHDFLSAHRRDGFTAFGGWQYPNSDTWSMSPQVQLGRGAQNYLDYYSTELEDDARPAVPKKIRFWREKW